MKKYTVTLGKTAKIATAITIVILMTLLIPFVNMPVDLEDYIQMGICISILLTFAILFLYSTRGYLLTNDKLIICRVIPLLNKKIPLSHIQNARLFTRNEIKATGRIIGNGGFFGYSGKYGCDAVGEFTMYATRRDKLMLLELKNHKKVAISPDDLGLLGELKERIS